MATRLRAARTTRTGVAVSHDMIHIRMKPKISVAIDTMSTPTANWVSDRLRNAIWKMATRAMPTTGTPEPSSHTIMVRPMMPEDNRRGGGPAANA
ncbi:hypothetical protein BB170200_00716 [Mycobacterium marinum]|nr:hypothetical protein BB170200_00716 [Mycobacterium marinum]